VRHQDDLLLITPLLRALDGTTVLQNRPRDSRDPAAAVVPPAAVLSDPADAP